MPTLEARRNAAGKVTSYKIVVSSGYDSEGKQIRHRTTWAPSRPNMSERQMEKEATAAAYKFEEQIQNGFQLDNTQTFAQYAPYVLDLKEASGVHPSTIDRYYDLLQRINPVIGNLALGKIRPQHLNEFYKDLRKNGCRADTARAVAKRSLKLTLDERGLSRMRLGKEAGISASTVSTALKGNEIRIPKAQAIADALEMDLNELFKTVDQKVPLADKTILEHHRLISTILAQAEKEMLITYNPARKATPPKAKKPKPDYYQPGEVDDILDALDKQPIKWRAITYLLIDTGARRGEILGLLETNLDLESKIIEIDHALIKTKKQGVCKSDTKTGNTRSLKLSPQTVDVLKEWLREKARMKELQGDRWIESGFLFTGNDGNRIHPDSLNDWLNKFGKKNDLPHLHPHAFRHTAASTMIANGVDLVSTAGELGHANATTTANIYAHQINTARAKAANVRAGVFAGRSAKGSKSE